MAFLALLAALCVASCTTTRSSKHKPIAACRVQPKHHNPMLHGNAGCLIRQNNSMLLVHHHTGLYGPPAGTANPQEIAQCTAARETFEETGLDVVVGPLLYKFPNDFHMFACTPLHKQPLSAKLEVPKSGLDEVAGLIFANPNDIPKEQWRYNQYQWWYKKVLAKTAN